MYKIRGIKETASQWVQVKSFINVSAAAGYTQQLKILEDMSVEGIKHIFITISSGYKNSSKEHKE